MKISPGCSIQNLRDKFLVVVVSSNANPYALEVNESFATLLREAQDMGDFTEEDIADAMVRLFELTKEEADEETKALIALWRENNIIED